MHVWANDFDEETRERWRNVDAQQRFLIAMRSIMHLNLKMDSKNK
jgi:hypothetical protein